jgi:uncharacterized damage-inducible protein DinB
MSRKLGFEEAAADHRAAIDDVVRAIEAVDAGAWMRARSPGKWSPAEIAQHLVLSYGPPTAELQGGLGFAVRLSWWKRAVIRATVLPRILVQGKFPRGAPAPRESRPKSGIASPGEAVQRLHESSRRFADLLAQEHSSRDVRLTHPYFGKLTAPQILRLAAVHIRHHGAQLCDIVPGSTKGDTSS